MIIIKCTAHPSGRSGLLPQDYILTSIQNKNFNIHDPDQDHFICNHLPVWDQNIAGKVIELDGVRIAGLGGVFRGSIWNPKQEDTWRFYDLKSFLENCRPNIKFRNWLPRKHWASIFPEDFDILQDQGRADILVCHQPPSNHQSIQQAGLIFFMKIADSVPPRLCVKQSMAADSILF